MTQIPTGWIKVDLEDALAPLEDGRTIHQGWSPQCEKEPSDNDGAWGVLKTTAIQSGAFLTEHNKRLPDKLAPRPLLEVRRGDVLITCAGPRGRCGVACLVRDTRPRLMLSGKMYRFRFDDRFLDPRYAEAYLLSETALRAIDRMKTGISDSGLNLTHERFRKLPFPVAPRAEQGRIVAAIEEQFSRLDAADEALHRAQRRLGLLRKLIHSLAVAKGEERLVSDLLEGIEAGKSFKCHGRRADPDEWGVIKVSAMTWGSFDESENKAVLSEERADARWEIKAGDLLLSRANTTEYVGASVLVRHCRPRLLLSDKSMRLLVRQGVDKAWLHLALSSPEARAQMSQVATGTSDSMRNISQEKVRAVRLCVPPFDDQLRIVAEVERRLSIASAMATEIDHALRRSTSLRRSILEQAFSGKLVLQDPSDEPASVLLERIAAKRAAAPKPSRRKGKIPA